MKPQHWAVVIGIPAIVWYGTLTNWETALALFAVLYANNLSQIPVRKI